MMINHRHQHAVGQGFFHTARLFENEDHRLRYVYDCGAMKKYAVPRDKRVDAYIRATGVGSLIDILFLSHIHYDHVSGVERLLASGTGLVVDTIVLPLLHVADRLIAYARAAKEEPGTAGDDFYRDLVADPAAALSRFGPRQILFVRRGGPGGAPGRDGPEDLGDGGGDAPEIQGVDSKRGFAWKLVGVGQGKRVGPNEQASDGSSALEKVAVIDDTLAFASLAASSGGAPGSAAYAEWLLAPFVDPIVLAKRRKFIRTLAQARSMTVSAMEKWLEQVANVQDLLFNGLPDLVTAYGAIEKDFNVTSLCLYSGPRPRLPQAPQAFHARFGKFSLTKSGTDRIAWLATGDAALASPARSAAFSSHYGRLLGEVATLTLPHHGSDHNLDPALIASIESDLLIAAADQFAKWRHPGSRTMQVVAAQGRFVSTVTSAMDSEVVELVQVA